MSNIIKIKRGYSVPTTDDLQDGELGFSKGTDTLYIKDSTYGGTKVPVGDQVAGKDYTGIIPIGSTSGGNSGGGAGSISLDSTVSLPDWAPDAYSVRAILGYLHDLKTKDKTNLVAAINESLEKSAQVEVDTTLTQAGQAADAAAVGEAVLQLQSDIENITIEVDDSLTEVGKAADAATVGEKIQEIWDKINYVQFKINNFKINNGSSISKENGDLVKNPIFSWSYSKKPNQAELIVNLNNGEKKENINLELLQSGNYTYQNDNIYKKSTFKLQATDEKGAKYSNEVSVSFYDCFYYGWIREPESYDDNFIKELLKNTEGSGYTKSSGFVSSFVQKSGPKAEERYVYYCHPVNNRTYTFLQNGSFPFPMYEVAEIEHENDYNYKTKYKILRSSYNGIGSGKITVTQN